MKNFTLLALALGVGLTCAASGHKSPGLFNPRKTTAATEAGTNAKKTARFRAESSNKIWCPAVQKVYSWWGTEWGLEETYNTTYTETGLPAVDLVTSVDGDAVRETNTYNENGMLVKQLSEYSEDGTTFENSQRLERGYDARLSKVITSNDEWMWMNSQWNKAGNCYRRNITRDEAGNITSVEIATLYNGDYDPSIKLNVTYGADGKAVSITESQLTYDGISFAWKDGYVYSEIEWENTDGQIYQIDDLMRGANRIKSANVASPEDGLRFNLTVEYFEGSEKYVARMVPVIVDEEDGDMPQLGIATYTPLDDNGSYTLVTETQYTPEDVFIETETTKYDPYGYIIFEEFKYSEFGEEFIEELTEGTVVYDEVNGYPLSYESSILDYETESMVKTIRIEFSDYSNVAGIEGIGAESNARPEYYNLQGVRVDADNLTPGIYIVKTGTSAKKVRI